MSGWHSANLSRPADCPGGGYSPGYWKNRGAELGWPSSRAGLPGYHAGPAGLTKEKNPEAEENAEYDKNIPKATMFGDICPNREHPGMTMLQVMQEQPSSAGNHVIAALLNAAYFGPESYGLSETQILDLYADYLLGEITRSDLRGFLDYTWRNH